MTDNTNTFFERNRDVLAVAVLVLLVLVVYFQASSFQFINLDDQFYVYENPHVLAGLNWNTIKWSFTAFYAGNWHPLTWLSLAADVSIFGASAGMIHVMNVVFHLINTVLAYFVFYRMTGRYWPAVAIAALFAVHPAHVESVAWISERKDVLCTMFWLLAMWSYFLWYRSGSKLWTRYYFITLILFVLGLMSKPMIVTLPFVFLLCDIWPLGRLRSGKDLGRMLLEKIPFFALSIASSIVTIMAQRTADAVRSLGDVSLSLRIENAVLSYAKYVLMAFFPARLAFWYPYQSNVDPLLVIAASIFLLCVTAFCVYQFKSRKYLFVGWTWFLGTLVPAIGLVQVGGQSHADRYTYFPYFGLFIVVVFGLVELFKMLRWNGRILAAAGVGGVCVLVGLAFVRTAYFADNETLFKQTLSVTSGNYLIAQNLCADLTDKNRLDEAEKYCQLSVNSRPDYFPAHSGLGTIRFLNKDFAGAEAEFARAVSVGQNIPGAYSNLAMAQLAQNKTAEAEKTLVTGSNKSPSGSTFQTFLPALRSLASTYAAEQNYPKASENLTRILQITPEEHVTQQSLAGVYLKLGRRDEAQQQIETVIKAQPSSAEAYNALGLVLLDKGQRADAIKAFERALQLRPGYAEAQGNLDHAKLAK